MSIVLSDPLGTVDVVADAARRERRKKATKKTVTQPPQSPVAVSFDPGGNFIYVLTGPAKKILYVGASANIFARLASHLGNPKKRSLVREVTLLRCHDAEQMARREAELIRQHKPPWNLRAPDPERAWTSSELVTLREWAYLGPEALAELLDRTSESVRQAAKRNRVSLRSPGETRGRKLLNEESESVERRAALLAYAQLCPCGKAPIENERTGLCQPCHLKALADAHRLEDAIENAQRGLWAARQEKSRAQRKKAEEPE